MDESLTTIVLPTWSPVSIRDQPAPRHPGLRSAFLPPPVQESGTSRKPVSAARRPAGFHGRSTPPVLGQTPGARIRKLPQTGFRHPPLRVAGLPLMASHSPRAQCRGFRPAFSGAVGLPQTRSNRRTTAGARSRDNPETQFAAHPICQRLALPVHQTEVAGFLARPLLRKQHLENIPTCVGWQHTRLPEIHYRCGAADIRPSVFTRRTTDHCTFTPVNDEFNVPDSPFPTSHQNWGQAGVPCHHPGCRGQGYWRRNLATASVRVRTWSFS